jgi:release factor glutamine methyltransferase
LAISPKLYTFADMQHLIHRIRETLSGLYSHTEAVSLSRLIIEHVSGIPLPTLLSDKSKKITPVQEELIEKIVQRLLLMEPIQYIIGETEFFGMTFAVNNHVLIPRPETEELVELIISENKNSAIRILDIGTGSGCIAIALKKNLPDSVMEAWDFSAEALETAKLNAYNNKVDVNFYPIDIFQEIPKREHFDAIVSNPPYVLESEKGQMSKNVLDYEPHSALFVPDKNPLVFYERIADIGTSLLSTNGKLYFEINRAKSAETISLLEGKGYSGIRLLRDISGNDRIIKAEYSKLQ